jgi:hypothetical protein
MSAYTMPTSLGATLFALLLGGVAVHNPLRASRAIIGDIIGL